MDTIRSTTRHKMCPSCLWSAVWGLRKFTPEHSRGQHVTVLIPQDDFDSWHLVVEVRGR